MKTAAIILVFALIQAVSLVLTIVGIPVIAVLAYFYAWIQIAGKFQWHGDCLAALAVIPILMFLVLWSTWWSEAAAVALLVSIAASYWVGGSITWIWSNEEDGIIGPGMPLNRWNSFYWSALRNPCNNLRFIPGVSKVGRPLWYWTKADLRVYTVTLWKLKFSTPSQVYAKAGWLSDGYPAMSAGSGKGF